MKSLVGNINNTKGLTNQGERAIRVLIEDQPISTNPFLPDGFVSICEFNEANAVASGILTDVISYTVPVGKKFSLSRVEMSGNNVSKYQVEVDAVIKGIVYSYWSNFNVSFNFDHLELDAGANIKVKVIHDRPSAGNFSARILGVQG